MAQSIFTSISPSTTSGDQLATILNNFKDAYVTGNSGTSRPSALQAGGVWVDVTNNPTSWALKLYNGSVDISLFVINLVSGIASITSTDSIFEIDKSSNDAVGAILKFFKKRPIGNQTLASDVIGEIDFYGNRDTDVATVQARITATSSNNVTASQQGAYLIFEGTSLNASSVAEWMRLVDAKLGIGISTPEETLHVRGTGVKVGKFSDDAIGSKLSFRKSRVTGVGQVQSADVVASQTYNSTDDSGLEIEVARIEVIASELHTSTAQGSTVKIKSKKSGTTTLVDSIVIDDSGVAIPELKAGSGGGMRFTAVQDITASGTIAVGIAPQQALNVQGSAGPQDSNTVPFATNPPDGTIITLIGRDDAKILTIFHNDVTNGCVLKGDCYLGKDDVLMLIRNATTQRYNELTRSVH